MSHAISSLEKELQTPLLTRNCTGVTPTAAGRAILKEAQTIFTGVDAIKQIAEAQRGHAQVAFACLPCLNDWVIPNTLCQLRQSLPELAVSTTTANSGAIVDQVRADGVPFDIVIQDADDGQHRGVTYQPLFQDQYVLYVGRRSPLYGREMITYADVLAQPYIAYRDEFQTRNGGLTAMIAQRPRPNVQFRTDSLAVMKHLIASDDYVAFFPRYMSQQDSYLQSGAIQRLTVVDQPLTFTVSVVRRRQVALSSQETGVIENLEKVIRSAKLNPTDLKEGVPLSQN
ncbi:LysR family transcriptional regulator [Secundilactobacillus paracollinoides]|uniref:LysR family transcriptional regulator n=1 Tax=Secundilactobacillus paracollinoides TaxID=240427 RepID=UPI0009F2D260|nr:LysR family transcriptional regulator [Secundilactobacillus paracollinoides]